MKICITTKSVKDFNSFFKAKALELLKKNNYETVNDLYKALYNEALSASGDTESSHNHDIVLQHLVVAPLALNESLPKFQDEISLSVAEILTALSNTSKLEALVNKTLKLISTPVNLVEKEVEKIETNEADFEELTVEGAVHVEFSSILGTETINSESNVIDPKKSSAFAAIRTVVAAIKAGKSDFKIMAMSYDKLLEQSFSNELDNSIASVPTTKGLKNTIAFVIVDRNGKVVRFSPDGNVSSTGTVPIISPLSPRLVGETAYDYFVRGNKTATKENQFLIAKFDALVKSVGIENAQAFILGTKNDAGKFEGGWVNETKALHKNIRESSYTTLEIDSDPRTTTYGYSETTSIKTPLSQIKGIENFGLTKSEKDGDPYVSITGSTLHNETAIVIPNDISSDLTTVDILIEILTNPSLKNENGTKLSPADKREILSSYFSVNTSTTVLRITDSGKVLIDGKIVNEKSQIVDFFNNFHAIKQVAGNPTNRIITKDLADPNNTSAMLYQDAGGDLYRIFKPKFSYDKASINIASISDGVVTTSPISKLQHVINTGSTKSQVNAENELRVYHAKVGYESEVGVKHVRDEQYGLDKTKRVKETNEKIDKLQDTKALSWWKGSPLNKDKGGVLTLDDQRFNDDSNENRLAVARFVGDGIILFKGSDNTDIYHEAWHAYTQGLLTISEKKKLYEAVRKGKGMTNASFKQIEEYLAEEFRSYALGKSKVKKTSILGKFFQSILDGLTKMFGKFNKSDLSNQSVIDKVIAENFDKLYTGNIDTSQYSSENFMFDSLNKNLVFPENKGINRLGRLSAQQTSLITDTVDTLIAKHLDYKSDDRLSKGYDSIDDLVDAYTAAKEELEILRDQEAEFLTLDKDGNPSGNISLEEYNNHLNNFKMLDSAIFNFGDLKVMKNNLFNGASPTNVIGFHLLYGKVYNYSTIQQMVEEDSYVENDNVSGQKFERQGNEKSLYDMADEHILYLLSTVPKFKTKRVKLTSKTAKKVSDIGKTSFTEVNDNNTLGVNNLERPVVVMAKLGKLLNSSTDGDMMYAKMTEAAKTDRTIASVLEKLGDFNKVDVLNQQLLWSKFIQTFSKSNNKLQQFIIHYTNENGNVNVESKYGSTLGGTNAVSRAWDATFPTMTSEYLESTSKGIKLNSERIIEDLLIDMGEGKWKLKNKEGYVEFYRAIGLDITDKKVIETALSEQQDALNAIATRLQDNVSVNAFKTERGDTLINISSVKDIMGKHDVLNAEETEVSKAPGLQGYYGVIQKIEFNLSDKYNSFMAINASNESQSELSLNNTASVMTNDINNLKEGTTIEQAIIKYPHLKFLDPVNDPFMKANSYHKVLFDQDGRRTNVKLTFENFSGSSLLKSDESLGLTNMHLDRNSKFMTDVYLSFINKSEVVRMADKSTSMHMGIESEQVFNPTNIEALSPKDTTMYNALKDYLIAEIVRMNILNETTGQFDQAYKERGGKFFIFDDILKAETKETLKDIKSTDFNEVAKALAKQDTGKIVSQINDYFDKKTQVMMDTNSTDLFITDNIKASIEESLNSSVTEEDAVKITDDQAKSIMIKMYARNKFLHNVDMTTLYLGDPALYNVLKEDFHKRNAGLISTGDVFRTDKSFYDYINAKNQVGELKSRGWSNKVTKNPKAYEAHDGRLNTAVINEHEIPSDYLDYYKGILDNVSEYENMEEADGQGFISFDSYRLLSIAQGIWTSQQEEQYNLIVDGSTSTKDGVKAGEYNQTKFDTFFPSMKLQHFGPLDTDAKLRLQGFNKFNLVPLIPSMVQGTKLEELHQKMMNEGIDYLTFESGSKVSTITNEEGADSFYNNDRSTNMDVKLTKNVIYTKYLKNQLKIDNKYKGKVTLPTQMRKILVSGIFNKNTVPTDFSGTRKQWKKLSKANKIASSDLYKWLQQYQNSLDNIVKYKTIELLNELGVKDDFSALKNSKKLVDLIRREFTDKDYTQSQINFLFDGETLKSDLSTALTADQVEKLLVALVDKRITKLKVSGEGLIQVASTMTEEKGTVKVEDIDLASGTNGLRSYYKKDGKVQGMQVKISLQGDFEKLLYTKDVNGKNIAVYDTIEDAEGNLNRELNYNESLKNLNKAIKDESWLSKYKDIITISAPRIPSQAFNSLEFMEIAEFLPKNSGNVMIVPSEIVAKAGSDFDVDKLFTLFPSIDIFDGKPEIIKYISINVDVDALSNEIKKKRTELSDLKSKNGETLDELYDDLGETKLLLEIRKNLKKLYDEQYALKDNKDVASIEAVEELQNNIDAHKALQESKYDEVDADFKAETESELSAEKKEIYNKINKIKAPYQKLQSEINNLKRQVNGASIKGLENDLLSVMVNRLSMDEVFSELIKPNSTNLVEPLAKKLADTATDYKKYNRIEGDQTYNKDGEKQISPTQIFDPMYNINKQLENSVGMDTLGVGAIGSNLAAIFSAMGMYLNKTNNLSQEDYKNLKARRENNEVLTDAEYKKLEDHVDYSIRLDHNTRTEIFKDKNGKDVVREVTDLASPENQSGENIADILGQLINGWVDVAKDAWIFNIQGNKDVTPTLIFLITAGVDFKQAVMLSSSKLVREYIQAKGTLNSAFQGLNNFDRNNEETHDLINTYQDVDALNLVINNHKSDIEFLVPARRIEEVYQDIESFEESLDMDLIEKLVLNREKTIGKKPSKKKLNRIQQQEVQALFQFIAYEQTTKQITNLSMASKFDTAKAASLAEIRNNRNNFNNLNNNPALPFDIKEKLKNETPVGMFDTNDLQLNLWEQMFSLKTHPSVSETANNFYTKDTKRKKADNEKDFAQEFINYIYQNESTRIDNNEYNGVKIKEYEGEDVDFVAELIDGVFYFNPLQFNIEEFSVYGNTNSLKKFFIEKELVLENLDMESEKVKESLSYQMAVDNTKSEINTENYDEELKDEYLNAEAAIKSGNSTQLFEGAYSFANRLSKLKEKFPNLDFNLVRDLTPDYNEKKTRANLYLSNIKEAKNKDVYEENLDILREHPEPEIAEFFKMFDRYATLQSGVKSYGKYVMTSIIDQNHIDNQVRPVTKDIIEHLDELAADETTQYALLHDYTEQFYKTDIASEEVDEYGFKGFLAEKHRGVVFESDSYFENTIRKVDDKQLTLDILPGYVNKMDKLMANESTKAIIHTVAEYPQSRAKAKSKVNKYKAYITEQYSTTLNSEYTAEDQIWISGEYSTVTQYGDGNRKESFDVTLKELFDSKYAPQIDKALKAGVTTFYIGNSSGIDKLAQEYIGNVLNNPKEKLSGKKFTKHNIVKRNGSYTTYSLENEMLVDKVYSTLGGDIKIDTTIPSLKLENAKVNLSIGNKSYDNIYKYIAANKSMYATEYERNRVKELVSNVKGELTTADWIKIIDGITLDVTKEGQYDEFKVTGTAILKVLRANPSIKSDLVSTGSALLSAGNNFSPFEKLYGRMLIEVREYINNPVTKKSDTNNDPISC